MHPEWEAMGRRVSAADRMAVSGYYSEMPLDSPAADTAPAIPPIYVKGDPSRGLLPCADCHGPKGEGLGPANPALAGQPAVYLAAQLRAWRRGERRNDPGNVMTGISLRLIPSEIDRVAAYAASLPGGRQHQIGRASGRERGCQDG